MRWRRWLLTVGGAWAASGIAAVPTQAELLVYYDFNTLNQGSDRILLDATGNGNHALSRPLAANPDSYPSIQGAGSGVSGVDDDRSVSIALNGDLYLPTVNNGDQPGAFQSIIDSQAITVSMWVKPPEGANHQATFWGWLEPARSLSIAPWSNNNLYFDTGGCCNPDQRSNGPIDLPDGEWHHWVFSRNEFGDKQVWYDGFLLFEGFDQTAPFLGPIVDPETGSVNPAEWFIGSEPTPGGPVNLLNAEIDEYAIFDEALDFDQIEDIYANGIREVFEVPDDVGQYVPEPAPEGRLVNLNGFLGGAAYGVGAADVASWKVERVFRSTYTEGTPEEVVLEAVMDLTAAGGAGTGDLGDADTDAQIGNIPLTAGADDELYSLRLTATVVDPFLGDSSEVIETDILVPGSGGGIPPLVLLGDIDQNGEVGLGDFNILKANFGATEAAAVPEPATWIMGITALAGCLLLVRVRK